jgi:hypothetical protein
MQAETVNHRRRRFLGATALLAAAAQLGPARPAAAATGPEALSFPNPLKSIKAGVLEIGYAELGEPGHPVVILLHGWPLTSTASRRPHPSWPRPASG